MVKKKTSKKHIRHSSRKKNTKKTAKKKNSSRETVRVKTFIVEKPVYIEAPSRFQRFKEKFPRYSAEESRYSRRKEPDFEEEDFNENVPPQEIVSPVEEDYENYTKENEDSEIDEFDEQEDGGDFDETIENNSAEVSNGHVRSRGLFNNIWWKKGLLKGFSIWLAIFIIFQIFDLLKMVEVIELKRWVFFLVLLLIIGMGYQKYISGKTKV